ncbi:MAG: methyltransferase domain-containing protein [Cyclobacteriaceae bacterium]|nr:methyltransferase domain-containing protein [Cyclobacteriaceae bacterium]
MPRIIIYALFFLLIIGCRTNSDNTAENDQTMDTVSENIDPSFSLDDFDDLVKKYEDPERVNWQNPDKVLEKMGDLTGKTVADVGVGTGYFAFRLVRRGATVIGIDIEEKFLEYIEERKSDLPGSLPENITTRLTVPDDPNLSPDEADWVLIVNTYYILDNRQNYLEKIRQGLKQGGKLIVVDFKSGNIPVGPEEEEKISANNAAFEMVNAGFRIIDKDLTSLQYQYIIVAQK